MAGVWFGRPEMHAVKRSRMHTAVTTVLLTLLTLLLLPGIASAQSGPTHGLSIFGDLKYPPGFAHFDYVNPNAPKGGEIRLSFVGSFDNINPFILKGEVADLAALQFDTLMVSSGDEADAMYGLIAKSVAVGPGKAWTLFTLDEKAQFNDGSPVTPGDVVFSFNTIKSKGHPRFRLIYRDIEAAEVVSDNQVKFTFSAGANRDLPLIAAGLPVLSKAHFVQNQFDKTTLLPIFGSGPYRVIKADQGRSITYARVPGYWAADLPVNVGRYNFDRIRVDYYRDREIELEAFTAYAYDFREEFTSKNWATRYNFPAITKGWVLRDTLKDERPSGTQAFFINTRREKFADRRVRAALDYVFDYEWLNKNIFFGLYKRTQSIFENSPLAARGKPGKSELEILETYRNRLPDDVFTKPISFPKTDGSGNNRKNLRVATRLLREAGWTIKDGKLTNPAGEILEIEFLTDQPTFKRVYAPYVRSLKRVGIVGKIRIVDSAQYQNRLNEFDYDIITARFVMSLTPGVEQRNMWGSAAADVSGSFNLSGVKNPVVDDLIEELENAADRDALTIATHALDRVLLWNHYLVPQWYKAAHNIAYWDKFGRPPLKPKYSEGYPHTWWYDQAKADALEAKRGSAN